MELLSEMDDEVAAWLQRTREWCAPLEADADSCLATTAREDMPPDSALLLIPRIHAVL